MSSLPEISVIVPVYNVEKVLPRCVDSVLNQIYNDFELLLIDDGSFDESAQICDEYSRKDERVRVFHKKNGGVSSARNCGLKEARGNFIIFIDSDDWVMSDFFLVISKHLREYDMLFFGGQLVTDEGRIVGAFQPDNMDTKLNLLSEIIYSIFSIGLLGYAWSMAVKRSVVVENNINFDESISIHEDAIFCYLCLMHLDKVASIRFLPYRYVVYDTHKTLSNIIPPNYYQISLYRIALMQQLLDKINSPLIYQNYILNHLKYWTYTKCIDRAYGDSDRIIAIRNCFNELTQIENFQISDGFKSFLFKFAVKHKNAYLMVIGKYLIKKIGRKSR